jgi:hypothetical protein
MNPITVQGNSIVPLLSTVVQRGLLVLLGYLGMTGFVSSSQVTEITSGVVALLLVLWGAAKSYINNEKQKTMESLLPDEIAKRK